MQPSNNLGQPLLTKPSGNPALQVNGAPSPVITFNDANLNGKKLPTFDKDGHVVKNDRNSLRSSPKYSVVAPLSHNDPTASSAVAQVLNVPGSRTSAKASPWRRSSPDGAQSRSRRGEMVVHAQMISNYKYDAKNPQVAQHTATMPADETCPLLSEEEEKVIKLTLSLNFILTAVKTVTFVLSLSMSILASLVDSVVDLFAQGVLWHSNKQKKLTANPEYPAGQARIEPVGVVIAAAIMGMASCEVVRESIGQLVEHAPSVDMTLVSTGMLLGVSVVKFAVYKYSADIASRSGSSSVEAIAMDNFNDCLSNFGALLFANLASNPDFFKASPWLETHCWMLDPGGAVLISIYIIWSWVGLGMEQVQMLVGKVADTDFLEEVQKLAEAQPDMHLDKLTAYHFGPKFLVELEMVMPEDTPLRVSHDCGISLQHQIESLPQVERCFVHIDYSKREVDDHNPNAPLYLKTYVGSPVFSETLVDKLNKKKSKEQAETGGGAGDSSGEGTLRANTPHVKVEVV